MFGGGSDVVLSVSISPPSPVTLSPQVPLPAAAVQAAKSEKNIKPAAVAKDPIPVSERTSELIQDFPPASPPALVACRALSQDRADLEGSTGVGQAEEGEGARGSEGNVKSPALRSPLDPRILSQGRGDGAESKVECGIAGEKSRIAMMGSKQGG
eukprot:752341-Hanusia_phi.AAC.1